MLSEISKHFPITIIDSTFGEALREVIKKARVVINIHYFDDALLETTRISECISLGTEVVSEGTTDQDNYPELRSVVRFFKQGDCRGLLAAIKLAVKYPRKRSALVHYVDSSENRFHASLDSVLVESGVSTGR